MNDEAPDTAEKKPRRRKKQPRIEDIDRFRDNFTPPEPTLPPGPFADTYRIAAYTDGLVGASPECDILAPHWDQEGLLWPDADIDKPEDWLWDGGVLGGITWDGTFYRDLARFPITHDPSPISAELFWSSYFKPGSEPGIKKGYWFNFGSGWSHLHNDDPAQILAGASQKLYYDTAANNWTLVIQATKFVTHEVIDVWTGTKSGGNDPTGTYSRISGLDPLASLTVEAAP